MNSTARSAEAAWLSSWQYTGSFPLTKDLSLLEPALRVGELQAAQHGCRQGGPDSILVVEVMFLAGSQGFLSMSEAKAAGVRFVPTHARFVMTWGAKNPAPRRATASRGQLRPAAPPSPSAVRD